MWAHSSATLLEVLSALQRVLLLVLWVLLLVLPSATELGGMLVLLSATPLECALVTPTEQSWVLLSAT